MGPMEGAPRAPRRGSPEGFPWWGSAGNSPGGGPVEGCPGGIPWIESSGVGRLEGVP
jgi:hypothetical protein